MRTLQCKSAWLQVGIVGVLAGGAQGQASTSFSSERPAENTIALGRWTRDIWSRYVGGETGPFIEEDQYQPRAVLRWLESRCSPSHDVPTGPWSGGPFLTRRQLEEYEQRQACWTATGEAMSPEQMLRTLAVLARWYPVAAYECAKRHLDWKPIAVQRAPKISVGETMLQQAVRLWLAMPATSQAGTSQADTSQAFSDPVAKAMAADVAKCLRGDCVDLKPRRSRYESRLDTCWRFAGEGRWTMLQRRYRKAYEACRDRLLSTYFPEGGNPEAGGSPASFPVGHEVKVTGLTDYENYELREWAWMEELLVRTVADKLIARHCGHTGEDIAAAVGGPQPFSVSVSRGELLTIYYDALDESVNRVATEQADDYASRVACAFITTARNHSAVSFF